MKVDYLTVYVVRGVIGRGLQYTYGESQLEV